MKILLADDSSESSLDIVQAWGRAVWGDEGAVSCTPVGQRSQVKDDDPHIAEV